MKIFLIIVCVLILAGMLALDFFIERDMKKPADKNDDSDKE